MNTNQIKELTNQYILNTYGERATALVRGEGNYVWDADGKKYLDFISGIAVNLLGHCHPKLVETIHQQAKTLIHVSNLYYMEPQAKLAELLCNLSFGEKCFFCNSGAEANEGAIKIARKYAKVHHNPDKFEIITLLKSFHGRTIGALTATGQEKYQKGFEPLLPGFKYAELNNLASVEALISDKTCAVMMEPIQGESGVHESTPEFIKGVKELCQKYNALLIFDEVQCGLGRTGKMFAYEHYGVTPDIMTLSKGLAGGLPIGAIVTTNAAGSALEPGNHASTFGGNPLCSAAAITTLQTIISDKLIENAEQMGDYLKVKLKALMLDFPCITEIRGKGLMIGAQLNCNGAHLIKIGVEKGMLFNCAAGTTLRFLPALTVNKEEIDEAIEILIDILTTAQLAG